MVVKRGKLRRFRKVPTNAYAALLAGFAMYAGLAIACGDSDESSPAAATSFAPATSAATAPASRPPEPSRIATTVASRTSGIAGG